MKMTDLFISCFENPEDEGLIFGGPQMRPVIALHYKSRVPDEQEKLTLKMIQSGLLAKFNPNCRVGHLAQNADTQIFEKYWDEWAESTLWRVRRLGQTAGFVSPDLKEIWANMVY